MVHTTGACNVKKTRDRLSVRVYVAERVMSLTAVMLKKGCGCLPVVFKVRFVSSRSQRSGRRNGFTIRD